MSTAVASQVTDFCPGIEEAFERVPEEGSYALTRIDGRLPDWLRGTYYLNGPARFVRAGLRYRHWLDGDGMVCTLRFADGGVHFANRFVRSTKWTAEEEAGRPLFRTFGTAFPGDRLVRGIALESPVNVSAYPFAGRLLAFGEQGLPWELDPLTLETRGLFNFDGALNPLSPFSAHPKIDPVTGELWNFGVSFSNTQPCINVYQLSPEGRLLARRRLPLAAACSLHDFCLAPRHAVFYVSPHVLDMGRLAAGKTLLESLSWEPERGSRLLVMERESGELVASVPIAPGYCLHTINGFEDEAGLLTVDVLELDRPIYDQYSEIPALFSDVAPGRPVRFEIDLGVGGQAGHLVGQRQLSYAKAPDFPAIDPRRLGQPYRDLWMLGISATGRPGRKFLDQMVHLSWARPGVEDVWQAPAGCYLGGEPVFVGDPADLRDERRGIVLCQQLDTRTGEGSFLAFDSANVSAGPVAVLYLRTPVHLGFHAMFEPAEAAV